jgi:hypothetical protein
LSPSAKRRRRARKQARHWIIEEEDEDPNEQITRGEEHAAVGADSEEGDSSDVVEVERPAAADLATFLTGPPTSPVLSRVEYRRLNELLDSLPRWKLHNDMSPRDVFNHLKFLVSYATYVRTRVSYIRDNLAAGEVKKWCNDGHHKHPDYKQLSGHFEGPSDPPVPVDSA